MKTIEERASNYAETRCINVESDLHKRLLMDAFGSSYIQGAKDYKLLTIEAFDKWLCENSWITRDENNRQPLAELRNIIETI